MQWKVVNFAMIFDPPYSTSGIAIDKVVSTGPKPSTDQSSAFKGEVEIFASLLRANRALV